MLKYGIVCIKLVKRATGRKKFRHYELCLNTGPYKRPFLPSASSFKQEKAWRRILRLLGTTLERLVQFYQYHAFQAKMYWKRWDQYPSKPCCNGILTCPFLPFCERWVGFFCLDTREKLSGIRRQCSTQNPITQILFTPEEQSYAKRRFQRYMATLSKRLAEGKITLKTHPNPPWKPADAHYSVIKFT